MCLAIVGYQINPEFPLLIALNRDEFFNRKTNPMHWWDKNFLAGQDLAKGGTWFGISKNGRWGIVTNYREKKGSPLALSRGQILARYLSYEWDISDIEKALPLAGGVNLFLSDGQRLWYLSNRTTKKELPFGLYVLSNGVLGAEWFKVRRARAKAKDLIAKNDFSAISWFRLLRDSKKAPFHEKLPQTGFSPKVERLLSSIYIKSPSYGTRSSYFALKNAMGQWAVYEKSHFPQLKLQVFSFLEN